MLKNWFELEKSKGRIFRERWSRLVPHVGAVFGHNPPIFDQQTPPRNHSPVIKVIVTDHLEFCFMGAVHVAVGNLLRLNVVVQFLLTVLEAHRHIGRPFGTPKEVEIIAGTLPLIQRRHGPEKPVLAFERNGHILKRQGFLGRRCARERSWLQWAGRLSGTLSFFWRPLTQKVKLRFSKFEILAQGDRERHWLFDDPWLFHRAGEAIRADKQYDNTENRSHPLNETG
jgi:hypothetical protein